MTMIMIMTMIISDLYLKKNFGPFSYTAVIQRGPVYALLNNYNNNKNMCVEIFTIIINYDYNCDYDYDYDYSYSYGYDYDYDYD